MQPEQLVLPTLATIALGAALLVPLRDDRRGKRATLGGVQPMRTEFYAVDSESKRPDVVMSATESTPDATSAPQTASATKLEAAEPATAPFAVDERLDVQPEATGPTFAAALPIVTIATSASEVSSTNVVFEPVRASLEKRPFSDRLKSIATVATGRHPFGIALAPDGKTLYVANVESNDVSVLDVRDPLQALCAALKLIFNLCF